MQKVFYNAAVSIAKTAVKTLVRGVTETVSHGVDQLVRHVKRKLDFSDSESNDKRIKQTVIMAHECYTMLILFSETPAALRRAQLLHACMNDGKSLPKDQAELDQLRGDYGLWKEAPLMPEEREMLVQYLTAIAEKDTKTLVDLDDCFLVLYEMHLSTQT